MEGIQLVGFCGEFCEPAIVFFFSLKSESESENAGEGRDGNFENFGRAMHYGTVQYLNVKRASRMLHTNTVLLFQGEKGREISLGAYPA